MNLKMIPVAYKTAIRAFCRNFLSEVLILHNGNITRAAKELGISRRSLQMKLKELGICSDDVKQASP